MSGSGVLVSSLNSVPIGFRFSPTKEDVLLYHLRPAIRREPLPFDILMKVEIYGDNKEPWKLFDKESQHPFWVFTRLKRKSKCKVDRIAGCGCWLNRATQEVHNSRGKLIGFDKYFTFTSKKTKGEGNWIMHEYSLSEEGLEDYVICQITNKLAGDKKRKTAEEEDFDDDQAMSVPITKQIICVDKEELNSSSLTNYEQNDVELRVNNPIMHQTFCPQANTEETPGQVEIISSAAVSSVNYSDGIINDSLLVATASTKEVCGSVEHSYDQEVYSNPYPIMDQTMLNEDQNGYFSINPNEESKNPEEALLYVYDPNDWNEYFSIDEL